MYPPVIENVPLENRRVWQFPLVPMPTLAEFTVSVESATEMKVMFEDPRQLIAAVAEP
jgi:hypothetical protein